MKTMINIPAKPMRIRFLIPCLVENLLWMNQAPLNPRKINPETGAMGMYSERSEARIGILNNQPANAARLMAHTNPNKIAAPRSNVIWLSLSLLIVLFCLHVSSAAFHPDPEPCAVDHSYFMADSQN
jgi:hypothetical protein